METTRTPSPLPYADMPRQWGVSTDYSPGLFRLSVAPAEPWRVLQVHKVPLLVLVSLFAFTSLPYALTRPIEWPALGVTFCFYGIPALGLLLVGAIHLRRRLVFEITPDAFTFVTISPTGSTARHTYPRTGVADVKPTPDHPTNLSIRTPGHDSLDLFISPDRRATEYVAQSLHDALNAPLPVHAVDAPAPVRRRESADFIPSRSRRLIGGAASLLLSLAALLTTSIYWDALGICGGIALFAPAGIVAGITFGTQEKDFYT